MFDLDEQLALARFDMEQNRPEQALAKLKSLLNETPVPPAALSLCGRLYAQLGLFERAQGLFERFVALNPTALDEAFQLGMVTFDLGDVEGALRAWDALLERAPVYPPALFYSALALARLGRLVDAQRNLNILLQAIPNDNLYFERGRELLAKVEGDLNQGAGSKETPYLQTN